MNKPPSFESKVPEGDNRHRDVCRDCGFIHYVNPRVIVGTLALWNGEILLARRAIEPRHGYWTLPAGFMEQGESCEEGALRETVEETGATPTIRSLLAVYSLAHISQVHMFYLADLDSATLEPGPESLEAGFFAWRDIPWDDLSFPTVRWALRHFDQVKHLDSFPAFGNPPRESGFL